MDDCLYFPVSVASIRSISVLVNTQTLQEVGLIAQTETSSAVDPRVGPLMRDLLSPQVDVRYRALTAALEISSSGDGTGLIALEEAIKARAHGADCTFYEPKTRSVSVADASIARQELLSLVSRISLMNQIERTGELLFMMAAGGDPSEVPQLFRDVRSLGGEDQFHNFQLICYQLQASAALLRVSGHGAVDKQRHDRRADYEHQERPEDAASVGDLRTRYVRLMKLTNMSGERAERVTDEQVAAVRRAHPDKTERWCFEKLLDDFVQDRR